MYHTQLCASESGFWLDWAIIRLHQDQSSLLATSIFKEVSVQALLILNSLSKEMGRDLDSVGGCYSSPSLLEAVIPVDFSGGQDFIHGQQHTHRNSPSSFYL